ncbi:ATP-binding cassette domain-containing protein [Candidatus Binatia bacterium]|nr:ATP-binding cassette domain-containing protein [Candidatus Binatia bacterium]
MTAPVVAIDRVSHSYGDGVGRKRILHDVCLEIPPGEIVLLTGPSGAGKSTLLTLVGGLRSVQEGSVRVFGHELRGASEELRLTVRRRIGYIFQDHNLLPFLSARRNVEMALHLDPDAAGTEIKERAKTMLSAVGLEPEMEREPAALSGGQKQRVAIARALVHGPNLVLADEPTAALDRVSGHQCVDLMRTLAKQQRCSILLVTHDSRIHDIADRVLRIEDGQIAPT